MGFQFAKIGSQQCRGLLLQISFTDQTYKLAVAQYSSVKGFHPGGVDGSRFGSFPFLLGIPSRNRSVLRIIVLTASARALIADQDKEFSTVVCRATM